MQWLPCLLVLHLFKLMCNRCKEERITAMFLGASTSSTKYNQAVATTNLTRRKNPGLKVSDEGGILGWTDVPFQKSEKELEKFVQCSRAS